MLTPNLFINGVFGRPVQGRPYPSAKSVRHSRYDPQSPTFAIYSMRYILRKSREIGKIRVPYTNQATAKAPLKYRTQINTDFFRGS